MENESSALMSLKYLKILELLNEVSLKSGIVKLGQIFILMYILQKIVLGISNKLVILKIRKVFLH
jgi:hypothetical protein